MRLFKLRFQLLGDLFTHYKIFFELIIIFFVGSIDATKIKAVVIQHRHLALLETHLLNHTHIGVEEILRAALCWS